MGTARLEQGRGAALNVVWDLISRGDGDFIPFYVPRRVKMRSLGYARRFDAGELKGSIYAASPPRVVNIHSQSIISMDMTDIDHGDQAVIPISWAIFW